MKIGRNVVSAAAVLVMSAGSALACTNMNEAMAHFEVVKDAYVAKAPTMTPEMFPVWTGHLETFGKRMGELDFAGACAALDQASLELGFAAPAASGSAEVAVPNIPAAQPAQPAAQPAQPAAQPAQPATQPEQPAQPAQPAQTAAADTEGGWRECPRGRCWGRE